jgi:hypothetical protein
MNNLIQDIDLKPDDLGDAQWLAAAWPQLMAVWQQLTGAMRPRCFRALLAMVPSSNQREGHGDPHLG